MKERVNQLFKDKLVLVMLVLGLLTIVAAAGAVRIRKGAQNMEESPYLEIKEPEGMIAGETSRPGPWREAPTPRRRSRPGPEPVPM